MLKNSTVSSEVKGFAEEAIECIVLIRGAVYNSYEYWRSATMAERFYWSALSECTEPMRKIGVARTSQLRAANLLSVEGKKRQRLETERAVLTKWKRLRDTGLYKDSAVKTMIADSEQMSRQHVCRIIKRNGT